MKVVFNGNHFPYKLDQELAYVGEDGNEFEEGGIFIESYKPCMKICDSTTCFRYTFIDNNRNEWCAIPEDFDIVD